MRIERRYEPRQVVVEVTNCCNLSCKGCPSALDAVKPVSGYGQGFMDWALFKSIIDRIDFPTTVVLWLNGEPLLHPDYAEMAQYVSAKGLRWYVTTNGHVWNEDVFRHILGPSSTCYQILFSLDGLLDDRSHSIEIARPGSDRLMIEGTISECLRIRREEEEGGKSGKHVDIAVKLCERGQDTEEIEEYIAYWLTRGMDYVAVGRMLNQVNEKCMRVYPCRYFWDQAMEIRYDGTVIPCSYNPHVANAHAMDMGTLDLSTPLIDFYNNAEYSKLREEHARGQFRFPCNQCGYAYCGDGFDGRIQFRSPKLRRMIGDMPIFWHSDYYNQFFSLTQKRKGVSYTREWHETVGKDAEAIRNGATLG
jgi:MoaA/NifB/PqqE/SkfB family radical SAM enzyme